MQSTFRMTAPLGAEAHQDYVIDIGNDTATMVATIEGSGALAIRDIVVTRTVEPAPDPHPDGLEVDIPGEEALPHRHGSGLHGSPGHVPQEAHSVDDPPIGAGTPFEIGAGSTARLTVVGKPQLVAGFHQSTVRLTGLSHPQLVAFGYYAGAIGITALDDRPVF